MKTMIRTLACVTAVCVAAASARADLVDLGNGMIYDTYTDVTWLQDASYAMTSGYDADGLMTWQEAKDFAENLVYAGHSNWRLPSALNQDGSGPTVGSNSTDSELGHLYFVELGNTGGAPYNAGPFINVNFAGADVDRYWAEELDGNLASIFRFANGYQGYDAPNVDYRVWVVADGMVGQPDDTGDDDQNMDDDPMNGDDDNGAGDDNDSGDDVGDDGDHPGDSDGDGFDDAADGCPNDPNKTEPGTCGCGVVDAEPCPSNTGGICGVSSMSMMPMMLGGLWFMRRGRVGSRLRRSN